LQLADAVQGLTAATLGTGRLTIDHGGVFTFRYGEREISAQPHDLSAFSAADLRTLPLFSLFAISPA
jgi:hypothetical protein